MKNLEIFKFERVEIRTLLDDNGVVWFCVKDVCASLTLSNSSKAIENIEEDDLTSSKVVDSLGRLQVSNFVNESGLYQLIFQSRKQEAKVFKKWVTTEVLPSIRKTGSYSLATQEPTYKLPSTFKEALLMLVEAEEVKEALNTEVKQLTTKLEEVKPKEEFYDAVVSSDVNIDMKTVAKVLDCGLGRNQIFDLLRDCSILDKKNEPYQTFVNRGYFRVSVSAKYINGVPRTHTTTLVTPKGLEYINKVIKKYA